MTDSPLNEYVAVPASGHGPGVLVLHAWWGLNDFVRQVCDRLAGAGLVALAPDLFHGAVATTIEQAEQNIQEEDGEATAAQVEAALDVLRRHPAVRGDQVGVMGFSFGAYYALWLADHRPQDVAAVVIFYGTGDLSLRPSRTRYLCHFAENDPYEPAEGVQAFTEALRSSGRSATVHAYPGGAPVIVPAEAPGYNWLRGADPSWPAALISLLGTPGAGWGSNNWVFTAFAPPPASRSWPMTPIWGSTCPPSGTRTACMAAALTSPATPSPACRWSSSATTSVLPGG